MSVYQIDYDLRRPGQNYEVLHDAIRDLGESYHGTESTFLVKTGLGADDVRDELSEVVNSNDSIIVTQIGEKTGKRWATSSASGAAEWLKENL